MSRERCVKERGFERRCQETECQATLGRGAQVMWSKVALAQQLCCPQKGPLKHSMRSGLVGNGTATPIGIFFRHSYRGGRGPKRPSTKRQLQTSRGTKRCACPTREEREPPCPSVSTNRISEGQSKERLGIDNKFGTDKFDIEELVEISLIGIS